MNKPLLKGGWGMTKAKLRQKHSYGDEDDATFGRNREEELIGRLQKRRNRARCGHGGAFHDHGGW